MPTFSLRPATESDFEFVRSSHHEGLRPYVEAAWGWDEAVQDSFVRRDLQQGDMQIIRSGEDDVGYLEFEHRDDEVFLGVLVILPAHQRRGIGTAVIEWMQDLASRKAMPVTLKVLKVNPARTLYQRLGFTMTGDDGHHLLMRWSPGDGN